MTTKTSEAAQVNSKAQRIKDELVELMIQMEEPELKRETERRIQDMDFVLRNRFGRGEVQDLIRMKIIIASRWLRVLKWSNDD